MLLTLEQERAKHAWNIANGCNKEFKSLSKGAPALIMSNGLMPALAFWHSKIKKEGNCSHEKLESAVLDWLKKRDLIDNKEFKAAMKDLQNSESDEFMKATNETLEYLKWLRNFASAIGEE